MCLDLASILDFSFFSRSTTPQQDTVSNLFSTLWFFLVCIYISTTSLTAIHAECVYL